MSVAKVIFKSITGKKGIVSIQALLKIFDKNFWKFFHLWHESWKERQLWTNKFNAVTFNIKVINQTISHI